MASAAVIPGNFHTRKAATMVAERFMPPWGGLCCIVIQGLKGLAGLRVPAN